jgi:hypothetical protein
MASTVLSLISKGAAQLLTARRSVRQGHLSFLVHPEGRSSMVSLVALSGPALLALPLGAFRDIGLDPIRRRGLASFHLTQLPLELRDLPIPRQIPSEVLGPFLLSKDDLARCTEPRHVIGVKGSRLNSSGPARTVHSGRRQARK